MAAGSKYTAATGHTAFSTLTLADFHGMTGQLPEYARPNAKWYFHRAGFANSAERLSYAGGGNTVDSIGGGNGLMFLGYPVVISQVMNSTTGAQTSTVGLAWFGDLRLTAIFGSRRGVTVAQSEHRYFDTDQIGIRGTERFDLICHSIDDTSVAGPLIVLVTPGS